MSHAERISKLPQDAGSVRSRSARLRSAGKSTGSTTRHSSTTAAASDLSPTSRGSAPAQIIDDADRILRHMDPSRCACGCEANTGDGAGILTGLPHEFLQNAAQADLGVKLPEPGLYGVGNIFLPTDRRAAGHCKETVNRLVAEQGQRLLGWRPLPTRADGGRHRPLRPGRRAGDGAGLYRRGRRVRSRRVRPPALRDPQDGPAASCG